MSCPPPIGVVPKEDCTDIADDYGALTVQGALPLAGSGKSGEPRLEAIRGVQELAAAIKDRRVKLCQEYVACKVPLAEHDAQDQLLSGAMRSLIDLWNKREFSSLGEVARFREALHGIELRLHPGDVPVPPPPPPAPRTFKADEALARIEDPGVAFRAEPGNVTISATATGTREAVRSKPEALALEAGHHYRVKVSGSYHPASPPVVQPGDELVARLRYHAEGAADLTVALRSLEDPDATDASESWHAAVGERGAHDVKLTADPQETGFYLGVAVKGAPVEFEDVELLRGGKAILVAKAGDPAVKTDCSGAGGRLRCQPGQGDRITLGEPDGYLILGLRDATGRRASTRAGALDGGRSVDATVGDGAELVITLVGAGTAKLEAVEVTDLGS